MSDVPRIPDLQPSWIAPARTALLVIDMQVDFAAPDGAMARRGFDTAPAQAALRQAQRLVDSARCAAVRVVFVRLVTRPGDESAVAREARARRGDPGEALLCVEGTPGADFAEPQPLTGERVVSKSGFSAFAGTGLNALLKGAALDTLVLCGLTTDCCVQSSAWHAFEQDFHIVIAGDACAAYSSALHQGALEALALSGAIVADTADLVAVWDKIDQ